MTPRRSSAFLLCIVLLAGFAGVWHLQRAIDTQRGALHQEDGDFVRQPQMLKLMSLEYAPLLADLYWTRVVQYYGDKRARQEMGAREETTDRNIFRSHSADRHRPEGYSDLDSPVWSHGGMEDAHFPLLWPLLDITTTLDPNLIVAYRFGSTFLAEPAPRGEGRPDLAIELIHRGIQANPEYWRLYEDLGFIYYFDLKDYSKASAAFLEGSKNPQAKVWMKILAAKVLEQGETRETSTFLWSEIYNSATDQQTKQNALTHLQLLKAQEDCEHLDAMTADYEKRTGKKLTSMRDFVAAGLLPRAPADPLGFAYELDSEGKAQLSPASPLFKDQPIYQRPLG